MKSTPQLLQNNKHNSDEILANSSSDEEEEIINDNRNKKVVKLISNEGNEFTLEDSVVDMCKTVKSISSGKKGFRNGLGGWFNVEDNKYVLHKKEGRIVATIHSNDDFETILCFPEIRSAILLTVLEYCRFHSTTPSFHKAMEYDQTLISLKQNNLCELASASYYLDVKSLVCLTSKEIAAQISQKSSDEIKETFSHLQLAGYSQFFPPTLKRKPYTPEKKKDNNSNTNNNSNNNNNNNNQTDDNRTLDELLEFLGEDSSSKRSNTKRNQKNKNQNNVQNQNNSQKKKNKKKQTKVNNNSSNKNTEISQSKQQTIELKKQEEEKEEQKQFEEEEEEEKILDEIIIRTQQDSVEEEDEADEVNSYSKNSSSRDINCSSSSGSNNINTSFSSGASFNDEDNEYEIDQEYLEELNCDNDNDDDNFDEINPDLQDEIDKEVEDFKTRLDLFSKQSKPKLTLPPDTLAALLDVC
ncbi:hypothetical protein DLAC_04245 [Tieghemostelium lacteum]|uniref:SKP1 component POZ domain-containing protein n=1 Tax=Tieghemostelium lacteum TaxID=361077 RepID=A0A151ZSP3_TIELA|nr:hypothetical protein DLAC_04245 [Tieghemostelium lacteum]|eukprot:KYQ96925.1 hypothetical protein DLAC_04245 [Tieghemostelium lacteum]